MKKWILILSLSLILVGFSYQQAQAGNWAVLTLETWPGDVPAGERFTIRYVLRQHGQQLVTYNETWPDPTVTAVHIESGESVEFTVVWTGEPGTFEVEMKLPEPGTWQWSIITAFGQFEMPPLVVVAPESISGRASDPETLSRQGEISAAVGRFNNIISPMNFIIVGVVTFLLAGYLWHRYRSRLALVFTLLGFSFCLAAGSLLPAAEVETAVAHAEPAPPGEILFVAKGCITCHGHDDTPYDGHQTNIGPNLSELDVTAQFLQIWLEDPSQVRPETLMPNLELTEDEIESLIGFLLAAS